MIKIVLDEVPADELASKSDPCRIETSDPRVSSALLRWLRGRQSVLCRIEVRNADSELGLEATSYPQRIPIPRHGGTTLYLRVTSIDWIEGASQYARLHHSGKSSLVRMPMKQLQAMLDPRQFLRVHRSTILNLRRVRALRVDAPHRRWAILDDDQKVAVSPAHWDALQEALLLSF